AVATRSGNLDRPAQNWSKWSGGITSSEGARITSPPARFLQWKGTLYAGGGKSPDLESVGGAYLPKKLAPKVYPIEITPANYKFPAPSAPGTMPPALSLPAMGKSVRTAPSSSSESATTTTPAMSFAKGYIGARWTASDENGDSLIYSIHIRGVK